MPFATKALSRNVRRLPNYVPEFAVFIDTHRDQPHVGNFDPDIHRGMCKPTPVGYDTVTDEIVDIATNQRLARHEKFLYVTNEWYVQFMIDKLLEGISPLDSNGQMATSHLRDPRAKKYLLKSFRQIVLHHLYPLTHSLR
jgi:hypothetical protein